MIKKDSSFVCCAKIVVGVGKDEKYRLKFRLLIYKCHELVIYVGQTKTLKIIANLFVMGKIFLFVY